MCSEACLIFCYDDKMPTEFSPDWPAVVVLLFAYLTTIPFWRATRILSLWNPHMQTLSQFALNVISGIPYNFFLRPLTIPVEPHYVIQNGRFFFDPDMNPQQVQIMPEELDHYVREWGPVGMPTERPKKRTKTLNSFMAFRGELDMSTFFEALLILLKRFWPLCSLTCLRRPSPR